MRTEPSVQIIPNNWTAYYIYFAIFLGIYATKLFQGSPITTIKIPILWTNIGEIETLTHHLIVEFHVACWYHMTSIPTSVPIIHIISLYPSNIWIWDKMPSS